MIGQEAASRDLGAWVTASLCPWGEAEASCSLVQRLCFCAFLLSLRKGCTICALHLVTRASVSPCLLPNWMLLIFCFCQSDWKITRSYWCWTYYHVIIGQLHFFCKISVHTFFSLLGWGFFSLWIYMGFLLWLWLLILCLL